MEFDDALNAPVSLDALASLFALMEGHNEREEGWADGLARSLVLGDGVLVRDVLLDLAGMVRDARSLAASRLE